MFLPAHNWGPRSRSLRFGLRRWIGGLAAGSIGLVLTACVAVPVSWPDPTTPDWTVRQGQALWRPHRHALELAGELVLATRPNGDFVLHFQKTPLPVCVAQRVGERWQIEFPAEGRRLAGRGAGPDRLLWLRLPTVLAGQPVAEPLEFGPDDAEGWRLDNRRTGERIEGFLSP